MTTPNPSIKDPVDNLSDLQVFARTLWGEARGEGSSGMHAVACVIANRARDADWWGDTFRSVCLSHEQFSCWNLNDVNRNKMMLIHEGDTSYVLALTIATQAMNGVLPDVTKGAHYYFDDSIDAPAWASRVPFLCKIGRLNFYE